METGPQYDAFISYRHLEADEAVARRVQTLLENYRPPRGITAGKRIGRVFRDTSELPTSVDLDQALRAALASSRYLIVVLSETTRESKWCMEEIRYFRELHGGKTNHILPVLVSGEPKDILPDELRTEEIREILPDGTERVAAREKEPICADVRAATVRERDRRLKTEILRIAAPLLGCGFDDLYQRHRKRRRKRILALGILTAAVVLGYAGLMLHNYRQIQRKNAELETANQTLTQQRRSLQESESRLLTESAHQALREGDHLSALREAVAALPGEDEDRPLYAPAEAVLWQVMGEKSNKLGEEEILTFGATLPLDTALQDYGLSSDGRECYILDTNGTVSRWQTFTGGKDWETDLLTPGGQFSGNSSALLLSEHQGCLFVRSECFGAANARSEILSVLSTDSGSLLWQYEIPAYRGTMVLSPDEDCLALLAVHQYGADPEVECLLFDLRGGVKSECVPAVHGFSGVDNGINAGYGMRFASDGSGRLAVLLPDQSNERQTILSILKGEERLVLGCPGIPMPGRIWDISWADPQRVIVTVADLDADYAALIACVDADTGDVLWSRRIPREEEKMVNASVQVLMDTEKDTLILSRGSALYALDASDGTLLGTGSLYSLSTALYCLGDGIFGGIQNDGQLCVGGLIDNGICVYMDPQFGIAVRETYLYLTVGGEGILSAEWNEDRTDLLLRKGNGFIAYMSLDGDSLRLEWNQGFDGLWDTVEALPLTIWECVLPMNGGQSALVRDGKVYFVIEDSYGAERDGDTVYPCRMLQMDPVTHECREIAFTLPMEVPRWEETDSCFMPLPGFSGALIVLEGEQLLLADASGGETKLLFDGAGGYTVSAAPQSRDSLALAAACEEDGLDLWVNGVPAEKLSWPEGLNGIPQLLNVGENGYVLLTDEDPVSRFAAYGTADGKWHLIGDDAQGDSYRKFVQAHSRALFAVADEDRTLRVYDIEKGQCVQQLPLPVPSDVVSVLGFSSDDRFVFCCANSRITVFSVMDGEQVYAGPVWYYSPVSVTVDEQNGRMYIAGGDEYDLGSMAYIVETDTWTQIAAVPDVLCFLPESGTYLSYSCLSDTICLKPLLSLREMIAAAEETADRIETQGIRYPDRQIR